LGRAVATREETQPAEISQFQKLNFPSDLFEDIIGHEEVKELLCASLLAEKPVHVLLAGPPALAKTLFLWDIERAAGEKAIWLVGSASALSRFWLSLASRVFRLASFLCIDTQFGKHALDIHDIDIPDFATC